MSQEIKLVFDEPKQRVRPPRHFADLDPTLVAELLTAAEAVTSSPARFRMGLRLSALTRARTAYVSCMPTTHGC